MIDWVQSAPAKNLFVSIWDQQTVPEQVDVKRATRSLGPEMARGAAQGRVGDYAARWIEEHCPVFRDLFLFGVRKYRWMSDLG